MGARVWSRRRGAGSLGGGARTAAPRLMTARVASITLRQAAVADLDAITEIERTAFADPWSRAAFASLLTDHRAIFLVASADGEADAVAGYVVAWFVADEGEIANLAT